jgi:phosphoribosylamine--glycine ligase
MTRIIHPTIRAMAAAGSPFKGVLYAGLMLTPQGPKLIEYNVRFGDPECQALMLRLKSDLLPVLIAAREGRLSSVALDWDAAHAITVVMAARGYPNDPLQSGPIDGLAALAGADDLVVFHAATKRDGDRIIANGGRVLGVSALGADLAVARDLAYSAIDRIDFPTGFYRRDIGLRGLR